MNEPIRSPQTDQNGKAAWLGQPGGWALSQARAEWVINPAQGTVEAANAKARQLLRLPQSVVFPFALDAAMPALRRLRDIGHGKTMNDQEDLKLWCAGRLVRVSAKVFKETMSDGQTRLIVRALDEEKSCPPQSRGGDATADAQEHPLISDTVGHSAEAAEAETLPPPAPRDDRETLREIARQIRQGYKPTQSSSFTPAASSSPNASGEPADPQAVPSLGTPLPPRQTASAPDARTLSKIAHELKTPLSAIVAAAEIMRDEQLGPMGNAKYLGYAGDIFESARHALDVINAMLTGTPGEARTFVPVDLSEVALATVSVMQPLARSSGINLEADCGDERLQVTGDATAIRQIIYNLISNALKFTPQGGEVHVVTGYLPKGVPFFVVRDTGEGMSEDDIVRAFYRDDTRIGARRGGGYGIGLPMVRRLAEMMNATIDVDSEPGKGTVVLVSFPNR